MAPAGGKAPFTAVVLEKTRLVGPAGEELGLARPGDALALLGVRGSRLAVRPPGGRPGPAYLPRSRAAALPGPVSEHRARLRRIKRAILAPAVARRLMAGRIQTGDTMRKVEMAWGLPQRSFMVNYIADEQHYVYFAPDGRRILLRFKGGLLAPPLDAAVKQPPRRAPGVVEKAPSSR